MRGNRKHITAIRQSCFLIAWSESVFLHCRPFWSVEVKTRTPQWFSCSYWGCKAEQRSPRLVSPFPSQQCRHDYPDENVRAHIHTHTHICASQQFAYLLSHCFAPLACTRILEKKWCSFLLLLFSLYIFVLNVNRSSQVAQVNSTNTQFFVYKCVCVCVFGGCQTPFSNDWIHTMDAQEREGERA